MEEDSNLILVFIFVISFLFLFAWLYSSYQENKKISIKQYFISILFAFISSQVASWAIKETESFEEAIRTLKEDKNI